MPKLLTLLLALFTALTVHAAEPKSTIVTPDEAQKLLQENKKIVVLDVRTPEEFASGHIPGAKNLDFHSDDFEKKVGALDKQTPYLVHCASGGRSSQACKVMDESKFAKVYHMKGGFSAWVKSKKPVEGAK
jgi:rhodanese-related sulfurtransferase